MFFDEAINAATDSDQFDRTAESETSWRQHFDRSVGCITRNSQRSGSAL